MEILWKMGPVFHQNNYTPTIVFEAKTQIIQNANYVYAQTMHVWRCLALKTCQSVSNAE